MADSASKQQASEGGRDRAERERRDQRDQGAGRPTVERIQRSDEEWRRVLTPEQYHVLREHGTERAFTGALYDRHEPGRYLCAGCGEELFRSNEKYDSGSGWPSFCAPARPESVETDVDASHGMVRTEVHCARCGGHLGHVFKDGPAPTGLRYCINSAALRVED